MKQSCDKQSFDDISANQTEDLHLTISKVETLDDVNDSSEPCTDQLSLECNVITDVDSVHMMLANENMPGIKSEQDSFASEHGTNIHKGQLFLQVFKALGIGN